MRNRVIYLCVSSTDVQNRWIVSVGDKPSHFDVWFKLSVLKSKKSGYLERHFYFKYIALIPRIRPTQWFTPSIGLFQSCAIVRATTATATRGAPMPGPESTTQYQSSASYVKAINSEYPLYMLWRQSVSAVFLLLPELVSKLLTHSLDDALQFR